MVSNKIPKLPESIKNLKKLEFLYVKKKQYSRETREILLFWYISEILYTYCQIPKETVSFVFPRVLMFPETKSRETPGLEGKQN